MNKTNKVSATLFVVLLFITAFVFGGEKTKLTPVTLMLNYVPGSQHAAFAYGVEKGIYAKEGIDLKFIEGHGSLFAVEAIANGKARFAWASSDALATAVSNDSLPVRVIGTYFVISPSGLIYRTDSGMQKPMDVKGKKIAVVKMGAIKQLLPLYIDAIGLKMEDITEIFVEPGVPGPLADGQADALGATTGEYVIAKNILKENVGFFPFSDFLPVPGDGLSVNAKYLTSEKDRDLNCRMIRATTRSFKEAIEDPDGAAKALTKVFKSLEGKGDIEAYKVGWTREIPLVQARSSLGHSIGFTYKEDWDRSLKLMKKAEIIKEIKDLDQYFTNDYTKCADQAI